MLDSKYLRYHLDELILRLQTRGYAFNKAHFLALESQHRLLQQTVQHLQEKANILAKQIGKCCAEDVLVTKELLKNSRDIKSELQTKSKALQAIQAQLEMQLLQLPNLPHPSVPLGQSSYDNQLVRQWGEVPTFKFMPRDHVVLTDGLHQGMDFKRAALMSGSRFVVLKGVLAQLERALSQWMLDVHTKEHAYLEVSVPYVVKRDSLKGTGQLPVFEEDLFKVHKEDWYLIPTGEVPLTNLGRERIFEEAELPVKYVACTPCFRSEAGSYGQDVKGIIRQHQFNKVELVQFVSSFEAEDNLEKLTQEAELILRRLGLAYRVMVLCTGDLGFAAAKTYDLEVWLPSQSAFREVSSCSYMSDFQARRLRARWRSASQQPLSFVHTLNGSGLAVGRTLVAVLENYQQEDGSIRVPEVLQPYMGGLSIIPPMIKK